MLLFLWGPVVAVEVSSCQDKPHILQVRRGFLLGCWLEYVIEGWQLDILSCLAFTPPKPLLRTEEDANQTQQEI